MEVAIIEEKKNKLQFELKGAGHTLCNALKKEINTDEHVRAASYAIRHPQIDSPKFVVETDGAEPKKTILSAIQRLKSQNEKFRKEVTKEVK